MQPDHQIVFFGRVEIGRQNFHVALLGAIAHGGEGDVGDLDCVRPGQPIAQVGEQQQQCGDLFYSFHNISNQAHSAGRDELRMAAHGIFGDLIGQ